MANRIPEPNLRRLLVGLDVEGESLRLASERDHLVHRRYRRLLCRHRPTRWIRAEDEVVGESHPPWGSCDGGLNMQVTSITIRPANDELSKLTRAFVSTTAFWSTIFGSSKPRQVFSSYFPPRS